MNPESVTPATPPPGSELVVRLPFFQLALSATNPRKTADPKADAELAASIKEKDVQQPLLVRPLPESTPEAPRYEIVAGSRRIKAAKKAGLDDVPCIIREMTDTQAREAQIIENLQRKDISALDEARGLMALVDDHGKLTELFDEAKGKLSRVEIVAKQIGKSPSYVYQRLKLCELIPEAQKKLEEGAITAGHAILLARMPSSGQKLGLQQCFPARDKDKTQSHASVRELGQKLKTEAMANLKTARFDRYDATLTPAGSCETCPKLAANSPALKDLEPHTCTDTACFKAKTKATILLKIAAGKAAGKPLVKILDSYDYQRPAAGSEKLHDGQFQLAGGKDRQCKSHAAAIRVDGRQAGELLTICADRKCSVHYPHESMHRLWAPPKPDPLAEKIWNRGMGYAIDAALMKVETLETRALLGYLARVIKQTVEYNIGRSESLQRHWE